MAAEATVDPARGAPTVPLGQAAARGVAWMMIGSLVARVSGLFSQIVLAAILMPSDFGKVGLALTVTGLVTMLVTFGVDDVVLQRQQSRALWFRPALWTSLGLGLASMVVTFLAAPFGAALYGSPDLVALIWIQALAIPLAAVTAVPLAILRASLAFRFLAFFSTAETVAIQLGTILLAWAGAGAYSFVIPIPLLALVKLIVFWSRTKPVFGQRMKRSQFRHFAASGAAISGGRLLTEVISQGPVVVLGLLATTHVVGFFVFAFRLAAMPVRMLAGAFHNVMFPTLGRLGDDPARQVKAAVDAARLLAFVVMPACFLQAALADPLLRLVFGAKWEGAIPAAQILSLGLPFDAVSWVAGALLSARGQFRRAFIYTCSLAVGFFLLVWAGGILDPLIGVAAAVSLYYALGPTMMSYFVFRSPEVSGRDVALLYAVPAALAAVAVGCGYLISLTDGLASHPVARIVVITAISVLYLPLVRWFAPTVVSQLVAQMPERARPVARAVMRVTP